MIKRTKTVYTAISSIALFFLFQNDAFAGWEFDSSKDPMTDEQVGFASIDNDDSTMGIALKCWNDPDATQWLAIITDVDFGNASQYPETLDVAIRADSSTPVTVKFAQLNLSNKVAYVTGAELDDSYGQLATSISNANSTIALNFMENISLFDLSGAPNTYDKMKSVCPHFAE